MAFRWQDVDPEAPQPGPGTTTTPTGVPTLPPGAPSPVPGHVLQTGNLVHNPDGTWSNTSTATAVTDPKTGVTSYQPTPAGQKNTPGASTKTSTPSYVDLTDPTQAAVWNSFQTKGLTPRDQGDFQYWVDKINGSGGMSDQGNANYWLSRMAQKSGGAGDYGGGSEAGSGADALGSLIAPFTEQFTNPAFQAPTGVDDTNDPGFSARMNAADDALQRSAAAKGSLLSGSTLKALSDYNSDYASNEYANTYNRDLSTYNTNSQNAYQQYAQRRANFYQNQDSPFAKLFGLAQLDSSNQNSLNNTNLGYAQLGASALQNPAYASYLTGGANATAGGQVGAGNAYAGLFGNLGNSGLLAYFASHPGGH